MNPTPVDSLYISLGLSLSTLECGEWAAYMETHPRGPKKMIMKDENPSSISTWQTINNFPWSTRICVKSTSIDIPIKYQ